MSAYTTRNTSAITGDRPTINAAASATGPNEAGFLDKLVGKTEEKIGELMKDPNMIQEGAIRAKDGKAAAERFKDGTYSETTGTMGYTKATSGNHTDIHDTSHTGTHPTSGASHNTSHPTTGGLHDKSRPTGTDNAVEKPKEKVGEWKDDPKMQAEGAVRATDKNPAAENFKDSSHIDAITLGSTGSTGVSLGHHNTTHGLTDPTANASTDVLPGTPHPSASVSSLGGLNNSSRSTSTAGGLGADANTQRLTDTRNVPFSGNSNSTAGFMSAEGLNNSHPTSGLHNTSDARSASGRGAAAGLNDPSGLSGGLAGLADTSQTHDTDFNQTSLNSGLNMGRTNDPSTQTRRFGDQDEQL